MSNDDSMKSLENLNDNSPGFEDKEMQIKIIHQNTEITNLPSCRPPSQSSLIIDSETPKRFIMVDQKLRLPTELRETFKFIGYVMYCRKQQVGDSPKINNSRFAFF